MKKILSVFFIISMFGCAAQTDLSKTKSSTGLGSSPFSTGGAFTAANANAINNAINDNDTRLDTLEALHGVVYSDGDGTYTDTSAISINEFGYLDGVTSAIQTQLNAKAASGANTDITSINGKIQDVDGDTYAEPEEGADDDVFRIFSGGEGVAEFRGPTAASSTYGAITLKSSTAAATDGMQINLDSNDKKLLLTGGITTSGGTWIELHGSTESPADIIYFGDSSGGIGSWSASGLDILSQVRFVGAGTVANIPGSPSAGDLYIVTNGDSKCDTTTGGGTADPYFIRSDGAAWECMGDGTTGSLSPDDLVGDGINDGLLSNLIFAWLTEDDLLASLPGSPVQGMWYPFDGVKADPSSLSVDVTDTTIAWASNTITDSNSGFGSVQTGMLVYSATSENNTSVYHVASAVAGTVTLVESGLTVEAAGSSETIIFAYPYYAEYGYDGNYYAIVNAAGTWYWRSIQLPYTTSGDQTLATAQIGLKTDEDFIAIHGGANGEVVGESGISLLQHISFPFDPSAWYDQESTYRSVPIMVVGDDFPHGFTVTEWKVSYVGGDPTTELDADLICDTTPDYNTAAGATVMDILDTTAGASTADTGFDSATCANGGYMYIHFGADPADTNVVVAFDLWGYPEED